MVVIGNIGTWHMSMHMEYLYSVWLVVYCTYLQYIQHLPITPSSEPPNPQTAPRNDIALYTFW